MPSPELIERAERMALAALPAFIRDNPKYRELVRREVIGQLMAEYRRERER